MDNSHLLANTLKMSDCTMYYVGLFSIRQRGRQLCGMMKYVLNLIWRPGQRWSNSWNKMPVDLYFIKVQLFVSHHWPPLIDSQKSTNVYNLANLPFVK